MTRATLNPFLEPFNERFKLYRTGKFDDYQADADEKHDLASTTLERELVATKITLQAALDQFQNARPAEWDRQFEKAGKGKAKKKSKVTLPPNKL